MTFKTYLQRTSNAMADREEMEIQTFEYLKSEKSFLDEIKNIFHSFGRAIIWLKITT